MGFPVKAGVPSMYTWENIKPGLEEAITKGGLPYMEDFGNHYTWLLRVTSWSYGLDWDVKNDTITLEVPFAGPMASIDTVQDKLDYAQNIAQDSISGLLSTCIEKVPLQRLLAQFERVKN